MNGIVYKDDNIIREYGPCKAIDTTEDYIRILIEDSDGSNIFVPKPNQVKPTNLSIWIWSREKYSGTQLFNKTFGIIGLGRLGEISAIAPIRYTRLFFAMGFGALVFNEIPDNYTLLGAGIIVISGLYAFLREVRMSKASLYSKS